MSHGLPYLDSQFLPSLDVPRLCASGDPGHAPRILLLYGSLRPASYSRKLALEAERILHHLGAETRLFDPHDLPMLDGAPATDPEVQRLREWSAWSEGQVWISPEQHGTMTGVLKNQIDWLPLGECGFRLTKRRALAVMQVCGGAQSFNVVNTLRVVGRWMGMVSVPAQASVPAVHREFDEFGEMKASPIHDRVVDTMEELAKFTLLLRGRSDYLASRYSERKSAVDTATTEQLVE